MIDPHVHCRDWEEDYKETIEHALDVAERAGIFAIFDMPNTQPSITSRDTVRLRLRDAKRARSNVFYGLHVGLTSNPDQIKETVDCVRDYFPKPKDNVGVVGLKMFAGKSVGDLSVSDSGEQLVVYKTLASLGYEGILVVHCEKESEMHHELFDVEHPVSHCIARPTSSEFESVKDQINFAREAGFKGRLHIAHVSHIYTAALVDSAKSELRISMGVTLHHLLLNYDLMKGEHGIFYKVNPPLRSPENQKQMLEYFLSGHFDTLETDHAPHTISEKTGKAKDSKGNPLYMSGIPWLAFSNDALAILRRMGAEEGLLKRMTHDRVNEIYGTSISHRDLRGKVIEGDDRDFYAFNPLEYVR